MPWLAQLRAHWCSQGRGSRGAWVAPSLKGPALALSIGLDLGVVSSSPAWGLYLFHPDAVDFYSNLAPQPPQRLLGLRASVLHLVSRKNASGLFQG